MLTDDPILQTMSTSWLHSLRLTIPVQSRCVDTGEPRSAVLTRPTHLRQGCNSSRRHWIGTRETCSTSILCSCGSTVFVNRRPKAHHHCVSDSSDFIESRIEPVVSLLTTRSSRWPHTVSTKTVRISECVICEPPLVHAVSRRSG